MKSQNKKWLIPSLAVMVMVLFLPGCHEHEWMPATCVEPETCECGKTQGEALGHDWAEATCSEPQVCNRCGELQGEPLGHDWTEATCTEPKTCVRCGKEEGKPLGHSVTEWVTVMEPTCAENGKAEGICPVCNETIVKELDKLEHTPGEWVVVKEATETEAGKKERACTVCGAVVGEEKFELSPEEIAARYKASCDKYKYSDIARSPDNYDGKRARFTGEVIQVQQSELAGFLLYTLRVNVTKTGNYYVHYTDTVYVSYVATKDEPRILEDDIVTMYGELTGEKTYTTVMGNSITIPSFSAEYIDIK